MNTVPKKHFLKTFLRLFLPLLFLFAATLVLLYWYTLNTSLSAIEAREKDTVNIYAEHFESDFDAVLSDLKYLSDQVHLQKFVEGDEAILG